MLWTKHMTSIQSSQCYTDLSHQYPSASWRWVSSNQTGRWWGATWFLQQNKAGQDNSQKWGMNGTSIPCQNFIWQWECIDEHFLSTIVLNLSMLVFSCWKSNNTEKYSSPWIGFSLICFEYVTFSWIVGICYFLVVSIQMQLTKWTKATFSCV